MSLKLNYGERINVSPFDTAVVRTIETSYTRMRASATDVMQFTYFTIHNSTLMSTCLPSRKKFSELRAGIGAWGDVVVKALRY